jgi:flagellar assembly factor FliW
MPEAGNTRVISFPTRPSQRTEVKKMSIAGTKLHAETRQLEINTQFGTQTVDPDTLLNFPDGLPGFDELKRYKLFHEDGTATLFYLQSVDDPAVRLPVVDPGLFQVDYQITLNDMELSRLQLDDPADAAVLVTVSRKDTAADGGIHANFMGPIIINTRARVGLQKALNRVNGSVIIKAE